MTDENAEPVDYRNIEPLTRELYPHSTIDAAKWALGKLLIRRLGEEDLVARIVEVEAYLPEYDEAAHAFAGETNRTRVLFGEPGHAYIFQLRKYHCMNIVAEPESVPGCVLIRAVEPIQGIETMQMLRGEHVKKEHNLTNGPGKLSQALGIDLGLYGADLTQRGDLYLIDDPDAKPFEIAQSTRIGITKSPDLELRFFIADNPFVSKP